MRSNNLVALYILLALGVILGWLMASTEDAMQHEEDCATYWNMVALWFDTDGKQGWEPFDSECNAENGAIPIK